jgi:hypothetical protein
MRVQNDPSASEFAQWLLDVGHARNSDQESKVLIPDSARVRSYDDLVDFVYAGIHQPQPPPPDYFLDRMILAPRNADVSESNMEILGRMAGVEQVFYSADAAVDENGLPIREGDLAGIPIEVLRSLDAGTFPPGELHLKAGCPIILLRNLAPAAGLCNGTRLVVTRMSSRVIEARIIGGDHDGELAFIPRIALYPDSDSANELSIRLRRRQFPIRLAFSLTINKAQGQSVKWVGLDLRVPVFGHGQLYVALSRMTARNNVRVLTPNSGSDTSVLNVVYPEVLIN